MLQSLPIIYARMQCFYFDYYAQYYAYGKTFVSSCGLITISKNFYDDFLKFLPTMLALCLMLSETYYPQNYAGIIGLGLSMSSDL